MSIDSTWLRCPNCFHGISSVEDRTFGCDSGHRFDRSKYGYLTLLPPKAPRTVGDDPAMLRARTELLGSGAYSPIAHALIESVRDARAFRGGQDDRTSAGSGSADGALRIADLGCGTGYYSAQLMTAFPDCELLLADRSPDAVRASLRALPDATGIVLDIWRPLPLRSGTADVVLNVFAPRNLDEFARVLRPDGAIVVVVPTERHLEELRREGLVLDIPSGKASRLGVKFAELGFALLSSDSVEYRLDADATTRLLIAEMGPSAHHRDEADDASASSPASVTISVDVLTFSRTHR